MKSIIIQAPAKINLALEVVRRRPDGYHDIRTVMHTLELSDTLRFTPRRAGISISCDNPDVPVDERNLAFKAALALQEEYRVAGGAHLHIQKRIPVAAGLGGGSSDAAATLKGLCQLWKIPLEYSRLRKLASKLGADVPFLVEGGCALGIGRGDRLFPWPVVPGLHLVVVNPGFAVPTPQVYKSLKLPLTREKNYINLLRPAVFSKNPQKIGQYLYNQLETVTLKLHPRVQRIKEELLACGAASVLMSGSGPTVFGMVKTPALGRQVLQALTPRYPFVCLTQTSAPKKKARTASNRD